MSQKHILITGGTGFLGSALVAEQLEQGHQVSVLTRNQDAALRKLGPKVQTLSNLTQLPDSIYYDAVINLAGAPIFGSRWTNERKQLICDSRIALTESLLAYIAKLPVKPEVLISGSAIGIYGNQGDSLLTEQSKGVPDFSQKLCVDWESAALEAEKLGVRVCLIRTGLVLDRDGGLLEKMLPAFRLGLGGQLGNGKQWMSWIHRSDWLGIVDTLLNNQNLRGEFNATAPQPVTNQEFSASLAKQLQKPMLLPLSASILRLLLGEMADLVLGSQRGIPERMLNAGYRFQFEKLPEALQKILEKH